MFGHVAFCETSFSESKDTETLLLGSIPIIYFNSNLLKFPLVINKLANLDLNINILHNYSLSINIINDFSLNINKLQNHDLKINKITNFTARR